MTKNARDFLDKELFVKRNIVTFRSLSRALGVHVNDAKNELQRYYDAVLDATAATPAVPTYLVSGEVPALRINARSQVPSSQPSDSTMDVDFAFEEDPVAEMETEMATDVVHLSRVLLVDARMLDETVSQFSRIHSVHIYSLSPSRLEDAGLVCVPSGDVRRADVQGGLASCAVSGKITGPHVKLRAGVVASSSKTTLDIPAMAPAKAVPPAGAEQQTTKRKASSDTKEQVSTTTTTLPKTESKDRPKPSGKLDWSKAKTKEKELAVEKTREEKRSKPGPSLTTAVRDSSTNKRQGLESTKLLLPKVESSRTTGDDAQKRGLKRKPLGGTDLESESESEFERPPARTKPGIAAGSSVKKGVVHSDEDDDGELRMLGQRRLKRKGTMTSDSEMSLRAIMDIDDQQVDRVSRNSAIHLRREEEESEEEEEVRSIPEKEAAVPPATSEDESDHISVAPKKRKPRKVVPVGRNGLKKRRVVKSRTTTDAKGYMQTEDYSSYESVAEEEEAETNPKGKGKESKKSSEHKVEEAKPKLEPKEGSGGKIKAKPAPKPRGGAPKRGGLLNFFGPERGKK